MNIYEAIRNEKFVGFVRRGREEKHTLKKNTFSSALLQSLVQAATSSALYSIGKEASLKRVGGGGRKLKEE